MKDYSDYINLNRYIYRSRIDLMNHDQLERYLWRLLGMAQKREKMILDKVCSNGNFILVHRSYLNHYQQRKFRKLHIRQYGPGYYQLPRAMFQDLALDDFILKPNASSFSSSSAISPPVRKPRRRA